MEGRKWEDLDMDCLVNVLKRVGLESLLLDIPFVCKSWYKASLNPMCWERLIFTKFGSDESFDHLTSRCMKEFGLNHLRPDAFIKSIIDRSSKKASVLVLPSCCTAEALKYAADECPALINLGLYPKPFYKKIVIGESSVARPESPVVRVVSFVPEPSLVEELIGKWKNLKALLLGTSYNLVQIIAQISVTCKSFGALRVDSAYIGAEQAMAIVTKLPKLKYLILMRASIDRDSLVTILQGCNELVLLDVRKCIGFDADDEEILKLASHIRTFKPQGSKTYDDDDFEYPGGSYYHYDDYYSD